MKQTNEFLKLSEKGMNPENDFQKAEITSSEKSELNFFQKLKHYLTLFPNIIALILSLIGFFLYYLSLSACPQVEGCVQILIKAIIFLMLSLIIFNGILVATVFKKIKIYHLLYIIFVLFLFVIYDHGASISKHGLANFLFSIISWILILIISIIIKFLKGLYNKRKYSEFVFYFFLFTYIFIMLSMCYNIKSSCRYWGRGLNNTYIKDLTTEKCHFYNPPNCRMNLFDGLLKVDRFKKAINYNSKERFMKYLDKEKFKNTKSFGIGLTTYYDSKNYFDDREMLEYQIDHIYDMDKIDKSNKSEIPEVTLTFDEKNIGTINISLYKNEELIKERKKLENPNSLFKNLLIIYTDSISRARFKFAFPKTIKFVDQFSKLNSKFHTFQFLKYHGLGVTTHLNAQPMFFGMSRHTSRGTHFIKFYKENGYITGHSWNHCSRDLIWAPTRNGIENITFIKWDHENILMFCEPNFYDKNDPDDPLDRGIHCITQRLLYGRNTYEYVIEYGEKFWETYLNSRKVFRMAFMDGHEDTGEVIKFIDDGLSDFLIRFYNKGYFDDTFIMFMSDHGVKSTLIYSVIARGNYVFERMLPSLFFMYHYKANFDEKEVYENQQKFISAYDIYETFYHICYGNDYKYHEERNELRVSLLNYIDESKRSCESYVEIKNISSYCRCKNVK